MKAKNHERSPENTHISVSMSKQFKAQLKAAAAAENRSVSNFICHHLGQLIEQKTSD